MGEVDDVHATLVNTIRAVSGFIFYPLAGKLSRSNSILIEIVYIFFGSYSSSLSISRGLINISLLLNFN